MKAVKVQLLNKYGRDLIYPACDLSRLFVLLTGRKCFSEADLKVLQAIGYDVQWVPASLPL